MSDQSDSTSAGGDDDDDDDDDSLSSTFLEFCAKVRNSDPSILPELGRPLRIFPHLSEKEDIELADALLENTRVTYLELETEKYTKSSAEAMAKYLRTSKRLQRIRWNPAWMMANDRGLQQREDMLCSFLPAIQESTSLKELHINLPIIGGPSNLALESMLTHTQTLRSLSLICPFVPLEDIAVAAARSGLKKNTTLQELALEVTQGATTVSPILTSLRDHPLLQRLYLCGRGDGMDLTGLDTLLLSDTSKITELDINEFSWSERPPLGLTHVLQALGRRPTALTKLGLHHFRLGRDKARQLGMTLCNTPSLQSFELASSDLGSAGLAELAPALYHNTSIKVLDISENNLSDMESARLLRDIIRYNKTITTLDLSGNNFGETVGAVDCIAEGLGSNSTLLKIDLSSCRLRDAGVSTLAQTLGSRNTTLQKLTLGGNMITSAGVGVLVETMEQHNSHHITDLDIQSNPIGNEGASLLARSLGNNALPNLTSLSLCDCCIRDDGFIALASALEQNTSLLHLDSRNYGFSERAFLALAESLPEIKVLQRVDFAWFTGLASAMPLVLAGLRKNTSLFRFYVANCAPSLVPLTPAETDKCAGGWMQEMERLGYRNRFLPLISAPKEGLPPLGVWPRALARVATLPDVIFEVLRSKPSLVPSADTEGKEAAKDTGMPKKRKRGDK
jgi:Ran GTPase-activating protein (RanGAP) involved in mRNA processing and transport